MADYYRLPLPALCDDGKVRKVRVRHYWDGRNHCLGADTYFSVPAGVMFRGRWVHGYVADAGISEGEELPGGARLVFHAHNSCDPWPRASASEV